MPKFYITFDVDGATQTILPTSNRKIRAGSKNYWYAKFNFLDDYFINLEYLSASFSAKPYSPNRKGGILVPIVDNECKVPWEMLTKKRKIYIGVFAGDMMVTNEAVIEVTEAAVAAGTQSEPTRSWYEFFLDELATKQDKLIEGEHINISDENEISADLSETIKHIPQDLTNNQKLQARTNIGAGTEEVFKVRFNQKQDEGGFIPGEYYMVTPYDEFLEAVNSGKTLWAKINDINFSITLTNYKELGWQHLFWDVVPVVSGDPVRLGSAHLIQLYLNGSEQELTTLEYRVSTLPSEGLVTYNFEDYGTLSYREQDLTNEEKLQARTNIGAGTDETYFVDFILGNSSFFEDAYSVSYVDYNGFISAKESGKRLVARVIYEEQGIIFTLGNYINFNGVERFYDYIPLSEIGNGYISLITLSAGNNDSSFLWITSIPILNQVPTKVETEYAEFSDQTIKPNKTYYFTRETSPLNIILGAGRDDEDPIYHFYVKALSHPITISLPADVGYAPGAIDALTMEGTMIEVTINKIPRITINNHQYNYLAYANYMEINPWD